MRTCLYFAGLALLACCLGCTSNSKADDITVVTEVHKVPTFKARLVNVTMPLTECLLRDSNISASPTLYLILKADGVQVGDASTAQRGWSFDLPYDLKDMTNAWVIKDDPAVRYSVELWDSNWGSDDLVAAITGLSAKDFKGLISQRIASDQLNSTKLLFVEVDAPAPAKQPQTEPVKHNPELSQAFQEASKPKGD